jgi:hypothetical protein
LKENQMTLPGARRLALLALASALALGVSPALAYVGDITTGLLRAGDAPPGFLTPHVHLYRRFHAKMQVKVSHGGVTKYGSLCLVPSSFAHNGWLQGVIESFDTRSGVKGFQELTLCAWRFTTVAQARHAYPQLTALWQTDIKKGRVRLLSAQRIGDQSLAIAAVKGKSSSITPGAKQLEFRQANAVVKLNYVGPNTLSGAAFLHLGVLINSRLR